jgi:hypothetical protein
MNKNQTGDVYRSLFKSDTENSAAKINANGQKVKELQYCDVSAATSAWVRETLCRPVVCFLRLPEQ